MVSAAHTFGRNTIYQGHTDLFLRKNQAGDNRRDNNCTYQDLEVQNFINFKTFFVCPGFQGQHYGRGRQKDQQNHLNY